MLAEIRTKIKEKLDALMGEGKLLVVVYDYHTAEIEGYPAVTFEPSDIESDFETNLENMRKYIFRIVVHQEMEKSGIGNSIGILADAVDVIIDAFDVDYTLGGVVDFLNAVPADFSVYKGATGDVRTAEIRVVCNKSIDIIN